MTLSPKGWFKALKAISKLLLMMIFQKEEGHQTAICEDHLSIELKGTMSQNLR